MLYLNCGCGNKYVVNDEWENIDFNSNDKNVKSYNLLKGLPYEKESVDVIYNSCMLEHLTREQAEQFLKECYRVLKNDGILRIVIPDLENVCREYLNVLSHVKNGEEEYKRKYDYIVIELIDQMSRQFSGGEMQRYWENAERDEEYIISRTGYPEGWKEKSFSNFDKIRMYLSYKKHIFLSRFKIYREIELGHFALSGELHKWMYDSYSITKLLERNSFSDIRIMTCNHSGIPQFETYSLEINKDGSEYKPNALYVEAKKRIKTI